MSIERPIEIAPETEHPGTQGYVLPAPPRPAGELVVEPELPALAATLRAASTARAIGGRVSAQSDSLGIFIGELRDRLDQLDTAIAEDARAQLKGAVRELQHVVQWCEAVQQELAEESAQALAGLEPIDIGEVCRSQALALATDTSPITVHGIGEVSRWGDRIAWHRAIAASLHLIDVRTGGEGARRIEIGVDGEIATLRVCSTGEPIVDVDAEVIDRFRNAVARVGASVTPDALGPGGAGFVLRV